MTWNVSLFIGEVFLYLRIINIYGFLETALSIEYWVFSRFTCPLCWVHIVHQRLNCKHHLMISQRFQGYRCKSDIAINAWRVIWNYAYSSFDNAYMSYSNEINFFLEKISEKKLVFYGTTIGKSSVNEQELLKVKSKKNKKKRKVCWFLCLTQPKMKYALLLVFLSQKLHHISFV